VRDAQTTWKVVLMSEHTRTPRPLPKGDKPEDRGKSLRVLLVVHELFPGSPSVPLDAFESLNERITLRTIALRGGPLEDRYRRLGRLDVLPAWDPSLHRRLLRRSFLWRLCRSLAKFRPHLLYVNSIVTLPPAKRLPLPNVPLLLHVHELESLFEPVVAAHGKLLREWPVRYVAVSEAVRKVLREDAGIAEDRIGLIHEFVRDDVLSESDSGHKSSTSETRRTFVVGGAGHPSWRKGISLWLQMALALRRLVPVLPIEFRWVGMVDNAPAQAARLEAKKLGVDDIVKFIPYCEQPVSEYRHFDVFAMTSWEDPCPLVVLENMALGKPVLCFAGGGGAPEEVGSAGIIVPEFNPQMMAAAVAELAEDSARRAKLGSEARSRVESMFLASVQVPKLFAEMLRVAGSGGSLP